MHTKPPGWIRASFAIIWMSTHLLPPKKQPPRSSSKEHFDAVKDEVARLKHAGAIKEFFYPKWLAYTMMVKKKSGKWRVCIDFTDLNKGLSERSFPHASHRPAGWRNRRPSSDELLRCLSRVPSNTISTRGSGENNFYHSHWKLPLQGDALWPE